MNISMVVRINRWTQAASGVLIARAMLRGHVELSVAVPNSQAMTAGAGAVM